MEGSELLQLEWTKCGSSSGRGEARRGGLARPSRRLSPSQLSGISGAQPPGIYTFLLATWLIAPVSLFSSFPKCWEGARALSWGAAVQSASRSASLLLPGPSTVLPPAPAPAAPPPSRKLRFSIFRHCFLMHATGFWRGSRARSPPFCSEHGVPTDTRTASLLRGHQPGSSAAPSTPPCKQLEDIDAILVMKQNAEHRRATPGLWPVLDTGTSCALPPRAPCCCCPSAGLSGILLSPSSPPPPSTLLVDFFKRMLGHLPYGCMQDRGKKKCCLLRYSEELNYRGNDAQICGQEKNNNYVTLQPYKKGEKNTLRSRQFSPAPPIPGKLLPNDRPSASSSPIPQHRDPPQPPRDGAGRSSRPGSGPPPTPAPRCVCCSCFAAKPPSWGLFRLPWMSLFDS